MIVFDESFEHEVFCHNEKNESRLVLYFDFWHPDLRPEECIERDGDFNEYGHLIYELNTNLQACRAVLNSLNETRAKQTLLKVIVEIIKIADSV